MGVRARYGILETRIYVRLCETAGHVDNVIQTAQREHFSVAIALGSHLFPFRTQKLSPAAPMVLGTNVPGRVGRRRFRKKNRPEGRFFTFLSLRRSYTAGRARGGAPSLVPRSSLTCRHGRRFSFLIVAQSGKAIDGQIVIAKSVFGLAREAFVA